MKDIPFIASAFRWMVTESPQVKTRLDDKTGENVPAVDRRTGAVQYIVMLFAKPIAPEGQRPGKGEEVKINLPGDPGDGFAEGSYVELLNPVLNTYEMTNDEGRITGSGLWFKADGLKPLATPAPPRTARAAKAAASE